MLMLIQKYCGKLFFARGLFSANYKKIFNFNVFFFNKVSKKFFSYFDRDGNNIDWEKLDFPYVFFCFRRRGSGTTGPLYYGISSPKNLKTRLINLKRGFNQAKLIYLLTFPSEKFLYYFKCVVDKELRKLSPTPNFYQIDLESFSSISDHEIDRLILTLHNEGLFLSEMCPQEVLDKFNAEK